MPAFPMTRPTAHLSVQPLTNFHHMPETLATGPVPRTLSTCPTAFPMTRPVALMVVRRTTRRAAVLWVTGVQRGRIGGVC